MKNTLIRSFVLVLALAGFTASSFSSPKTATANKTTATVMVPHMGSPTPLCLPRDKTYCGMD
jgi:hypothetical protein